METPYKFITAKLSIRKPGFMRSVNPSLRIESFAVINLRGISTNKKYYMFYRHANLQRTYYD